MKKAGLIVGKFAPLHKGHEALLKTAVDFVDELVVLVYDVPDITHVPLPVRASWIRALYPRTIILEGHNPPPRDGWTPERTREHEEFIKNLVLPHHITHVFSGEKYGELLARLFQAEHVRIPKTSDGVALSATMVRSHPEARRFVNKNVYRDMVKYGDVAR